MRGNLNRQTKELKSLAVPDMVQVQIQIGKDPGAFLPLGQGGAEDPPRRSASYLGGKELEPLFAHCKHHYSFPLQKFF